MSHAIHLRSICCSTKTQISLGILHFVWQSCDGPGSLVLTETPYKHWTVHLLFLPFYLINSLNEHLFKHLLLLSLGQSPVNTSGWAHGIHGLEHSPDTKANAQAPVR